VGKTVCCFKASGVFVVTEKIFSCQLVYIVLKQNVNEESLRRNLVFLCLNTMCPACGIDRIFRSTRGRPDRESHV